MTRGNACLAASLLLFVGCAKRPVTVQTPQAPKPDADSHAENYLDLAPGWRLHVVTPISRSGTTKVGYKPASEQGNTITLETDSDFLGYETSYYQVAQRDRGVRIQFASVERTIDGKASPAVKPQVPLFIIPGRIRHVRLLYLIRQSEADHDMAVLGADTLPHLEALTNSVRINPDACSSTRDRYCSWPPVGIAIRAEVREQTGAWRPAR